MKLSIIFAVSVAAIVFLSGCTLPAGGEIRFPSPACGNGECQEGEMAISLADLGTCPIDCGQSCAETDGGVNYYAEGPATQLDAKGTPLYTEGDYCLDSTYLSEAFCYNGGIRRVRVECSNGCLNSKCTGTGASSIKFCTYFDPQLPFDSARTIVRGVGEKACSPVDEKLYSCNTVNDKPVWQLTKDCAANEVCTGDICTMACFNETDKGDNPYAFGTMTYYNTAQKKFDIGGDGCQLNNPTYGDNLQELYCCDRSDPNYALGICVKHYKTDYYCAAGCVNGTCLVTNTKAAQSYSNKEVFLISDKNWRDVLGLVPVAVWTESKQIHKYPTLIYQEEAIGFDADSIIHFMQQYNPTRVTIVGSSPQELDNLLTAPGIGAGLPQSQIRRITANDYFSYWSGFKDVVYVADNYELALLASTYASLINAPLVVKGTAADVANTFAKRNVIGIGACPSETTCSEQRSLEQLQQTYMQLTETDKIILVNPTDLGIKVVETFQPEKSAGTISWIYSKTSLAAPFLASGKQELIISTTSTDYLSVDNYIENKINALGINSKYLTIMATPDAIQQGRDLPSATATYSYKESLDRLYASIHSDKFPDMAFGRIFGITISDVSAYVARALFYDELFGKLYGTNAWKLVATSDIIPPHSDFHDNGYAVNCINWLSQWSDWPGYGPVSYTKAKCDYFPSTFADIGLENTQFFFSYSHGFDRGITLGPDSNGETIFYYSDIPQLGIPFVGVSACSTMDYDNAARKHRLFATNMIRRGAIGYWGAISLSSTTDTQNYLINAIVDDKTIGEAVRLFYASTFYDTTLSDAVGLSYTLLGDPTIKLAHNIKTIGGSPVTFSEQYMQLSITKTANTLTLEGMIKNDWPIEQMYSYTAPYSNTNFTYVKLVELPKEYIFDDTNSYFYGVTYYGDKCYFSHVISNNVPITGEIGCIGQSPDVNKYTVKGTPLFLKTQNECRRWNTSGTSTQCFGGYPCCYYAVYPLDRGSTNEWWVAFPRIPENYNTRLTFKR